MERALEIQLFEPSTVLARNSPRDTLRTTEPKYDGKNSACLIFIGRIFKPMEMIKRQRHALRFHEANSTEQHVQMRLFCLL